MTRLFALHPRTCLDCPVVFTPRFEWMRRCAECGLRRAEHFSGRLNAARWWLTSKSKPHNDSALATRNVEAA